MAKPEINKVDVEAGKALFRGMKPAKEARLDALRSAIAPYADDVRDALNRGVNKAEVLRGLEKQIGKKLTAKQLDQALGGGTMRRKGTADPIVDASMGKAYQSRSTESA